MALNIDAPLAVKIYLNGGVAWRRNNINVGSSGEYAYDSAGHYQRTGEVFYIRLSSARVARHHMKYDKAYDSMSTNDWLALARKSAIENTEICLAGKTSPAIRKLLNLLPGVNLTFSKGVVYFNGAEVKDLHAWIPVHGGYGPQPD